jgi:hypothetical protein
VKNARHFAGRSLFAAKNVGTAASAVQVERSSTGFLGGEDCEENRQGTKKGRPFRVGLS